jgi:hypothetical protein
MRQIPVRAMAFRNLSTRMRQRSRGFYEGSGVVAERGVSCRGVLAVARDAT